MNKLKSKLKTKKIILIVIIGILFLMIFVNRYSVPKGILIEQNLLNSSTYTSYSIVFKSEDEFSEKLTIEGESLNYYFEDFNNDGNKDIIFKSSTHKDRFVKIAFNPSKNNVFTVVEKYKVSTVSSAQGIDDRP